MATYLERYRDGEHAVVWTELLAHGAAVRQEPLLADAVAVAHETMRRVRANTEILIARLDGLGYQFMGDPTEYTETYHGVFEDPPRLLVPPENTREQLYEIEQEVGLLPIALRAFFEVVGAVNLLGEPPLPTVEDAEFMDLIDSDYHRDGWRAGAKMDPLFVFSVATHHRWMQHHRAHRTPGEPRPAQTEFVLFPDSLVKYGISGFVPVVIELPCADADAPLRFSEHGPVLDPDSQTPLHFVEYLRLTLGRGGFAGFGMPDFSTPPLDAELQARLVDGLLPF